MKIDVLCSNQDHPITPCLLTWIEGQALRHKVRLIHSKEQLDQGDVLFLISCTEKIPADLRSLYQKCVVLHASDLPYGRGWSPHIWSILHGNTTVTVSAITAEDNIDSGDIWAKKSFDVAPHELYDEINTSLFAIEIDLLNEVIEMIDSGVSPHPQPNKEATYFPRRTPEDSELDPDLTIAEQFDKIRVGDPERYPAFFRMHGKKYAVSLRKVDNDE